MQVKPQRSGGPGFPSRRALFVIVLDALADDKLLCGDAKALDVAGGLGGMLGRSAW